LTSLPPTGSSIDRGVGDAAANQLDLLLLDQVGDVLLAAGGEVVEDAHLVAFFDERVCEIGADETCAAGHEIMRHTRVLLS
jgi:hypothetical protein